VHKIDPIKAVTHFTQDGTIVFASNVGQDINVSDINTFPPTPP